MEYHAPMDEHEYKRLLAYALEIGSRLLCFGAEITRVESTIQYICKAYGVHDCDVFTLPNTIHATIGFADDYYTSKIKIIKNARTDLYKIEMLNELSREICKNKPSMDEFKQLIIDFDKMKFGKSQLLLYLGAFIACFGFSIFFGGSFRDGLAAGLVGFFMLAISKHIKKYMNALFTTVLVALCGALLCVLLCFIHVGEHASSVIIGAVMILTPGMAIGTAFKDFMLDDTLSGTIRVMQSLIKAFAIAVGIFIIIKIFPDRFEQDSVTPEIWIKLVGGIMAGMGFALMYNCRLKLLIFVFFSSAIIVSSYIGITELLGSDFNKMILTFIPILLGALFAEIIARIIKVPAITFIMPTSIALAPGSRIYYAMNALVHEHYVACSGYLQDVLYIAIGIGAGISIANLIVRLYYKAAIKKKKENKNVGV